MSCLILNYWFEKERTIDSDECISVHRETWGLWNYKAWVVFVVFSVLIPLCTALKSSYISAERLWFSPSAYFIIVDKIIHELNVSIWFCCGVHQESSSGNCTRVVSSVKQPGKSVHRPSLPMEGKTSFLGLLPFIFSSLKRMDVSSYHFATKFFQNETHSIFQFFDVRKKLVTCIDVYNYSIAKSISCETPSLTRTMFI